MSESEILKFLLIEAKHDLLISERKFQTLIEKSFDMISLVLPNGQITYASPALCNALGYAKEDISRKHDLELIHKEDIATRIDSIQNVINVPGTSVFLKQRIQKKDGGWLWCEGTITNMLNEPGISALVSNFKDISHRIEIEKALEKKDKRFRDFFENAPEAITIVDVESMAFVKHNTNAVTLLKQSSEELLKKGPLDFSPKYQPCGNTSLKKAQEMIMRTLNGEKMIFEWLAVNGLGESFYCEVRLRLLSDSPKHRIYASFVDITERKEKEKILNEQNQRLSEIAAFQSHQVRQPVANILGLISLFNFEDHNDPINHQILQKMQLAAHNFDSIIKQIVNRANTEKR